MASGSPPKQENGARSGIFSVALWADAVMGTLIRICGYSAIIFVFSIFFFVFKEAAPLLFRGDQQWFVWTAPADGSLAVHIDYKADHGRLGLTLLDEERKEIADSATGEGHEVVTDDVAAGEKFFLVVRGLESGVHAVYDMHVDGPTDTEGVPDYPDEADHWREAWDLGQGDVEHEELELIGPLNLFKFFTHRSWSPTSEPPSHGILPLIMGTLSVTALAMVIAVPFGLGAAVYVSEFCTGRLKETLKIVIELLAAIPSIVWGFIGVMVVNPLIIWATGAPIGLCVLNGGIILALMSVPIIVSVGEDSLKAVPGSYREAAIAMGASRWQIVYKVLFPAAKNGLLAAVLLGVGRAVGETMAVLMCTGHSPQIPTGVLSSVQTLTATIAAELGEAPRGGTHYQVLFLIGIVLFAIAFAVNLTADLVVKGIKNQKT